MITSNDDKDHGENPIANVIKDAWDTLPGKVVFTGIGFLGLLAFGGLALKVGTFFMNNYKNFRDEFRR